MRFRKFLLFFLSGIAVILVQACKRAPEEPGFEGRHFAGRGDVEYIKLLDISRRMMAPDPEFQNLAMLYEPRWNGLVEGPTWGAWWIQNSYGTTYNALPFLVEPFTTFLQNAQDLWFDQMGDGKRRGNPFNLVAPDGCLCDAASPGWIFYKQGDGQVKIHDWGFEFTAAGVLMQAELLLISRDAEAISRYLPKLERSADFIDSRRDPKSNLFLVGPAANLLAPSYAGWKRPDGTYDKAYLAGLSVTTIAALDRLIELEKLAGRMEKAEEYSRRRELVRSGLPLLTTEEGYFIMSLDPDGTKHGVYGAAKHGYFEAPPNHDAIAFRVVPDDQARKIFAKMASIPGLRPYDLILPNYPSYDDMYEKLEGIWKYGHWVNGGHWSTCEGRMILAYYRLGQFEDARRSILRMLDFARRFRLDNPLTNFGSDVYQPKQPINITIDAFAPMAAFVRGLFEYIYAADALTVCPHIPPAVSRLEQKDPVRFGAKKLWLFTRGSGPVTAVMLNGKPWAAHDESSVRLAYAETPDDARLEIFLGQARPDSQRKETVRAMPPPAASSAPLPPSSASSLASQERTSANPSAPSTSPSPSSASTPGALKPVPAKPESGTLVGPPWTEEMSALETASQAFLEGLENAGLGSAYEAAHARLVLEALDVCRRRKGMLESGILTPLAEPSRAAAEQAYSDAALRLGRGLEMLLKSYETSGQETRARIYKIFHDTLR